MLFLMFVKGMLSSAIMIRSTGALWLSEPIFGFFSYVQNLDFVQNLLSVVQSAKQRSEV